MLQVADIDFHAAEESGRTMVTGVHTDGTAFEQVLPAFLELVSCQQQPLSISLRCQSPASVTA